MAAQIFIIAVCSAIGAFMIWMIKETLKMTYMSTMDAIGLGTCVGILIMCIGGILVALAG